MSKDLRDSLGVWAAVIAFVAISWVVLRADLFQGLADRMPSNWVWFVLGVAGLWNLVQFGWGLWQRRASKVR